MGFIIVVVIDNGFNDVCGLVNLFLNIFSFDCDDFGENMVELMVMDLSGNSSFCLVIVIVEDNIVL